MNKRYISWDELHTQVKDLANQINNRSWIPDYIVGIARGGLIPAVILSHIIHKPMRSLDWSTRDFVHRDNAAMAQLRALSYGRKILFVDDIVDSGQTFQEIFNTFNSDSIRFASLQYNTDQNFVPDYFSESLSRKEDDRWIVYPFEV